MTVSREKFAVWFTKNPSLSVERGTAIYQALCSLPNGETILDLAIEHGYKAEKMEDMLGAINKPVVPATVISIPGPTTPKRSVFQGLKTKLVKKEKAAPNSGNSIPGRKLTKKPSKKVLLIGGGIILVFLLAVVAIFVLGKKNSNLDISFEVPQSLATTYPNDVILETESPTVVVESGGSILSEPVTVSEEAVVAREIKETKEKTLLSFEMHPPTSIPDLFTNPDWNFFIFLFVLVVMVILTKQERYVEKQQTDWRVISAGYITILVGLLFSGLIAKLLDQFVVFVIGINFVFDPVWVKMILVAVGLALFVAAAVSGKVDLTPISVGLFVTGGLLVALYPDGAGRMVGYLMMLVGIVVHLIELTTEQGTAGALGIVLVGLPLFIGLRIGFEALFGLIGKAVLPDSGFVRWLAIAAFNSRILWSTVLSLTIGFALSSMVATLIFPQIAKLGNLGGQIAGPLVPTEDTPRIDAIVTFLMGVVTYWLIVGHF